MPRAYGYGLGLPFYRPLLGRGINVPNAVINLAGQSVSVPALTAGNAALALEGQTISPLIIAPLATLDIAGQTIAPTIITPIATLDIAGQTITVPVGAPIENTANDNTTTAATSLTFTGKAIGAAASNRVVVVCVTSRTAIPNGCTIGGVTATLAAAETGNSGSVVYYAAIYYATITTGTTADVVVSFNATTSAVSMSVFRISGGRVLDATAGGSTLDANGHMNTTFNIHDGGVAVWAGGQSTFTTAVFSSATQAYTSQPGGGRLFFSGYKAASADALPHTETMGENIAGTYAHVFVGASFKLAA